MNTQHDNQIKKQETLEKTQAKEREQLQKTQRAETDKEKERLEKKAEVARIAREAAEKVAVKRGDEEKKADNEAKSLI